MSNNVIISMVTFIVASVVSLALIAFDRTKIRSFWIHVCAMVTVSVALGCQLWYHWWFHAAAMAILMVVTVELAWLAWKSHKKVVEKNITVKACKMPALTQMVSLPEGSGMERLADILGIDLHDDKHPWVVTINNQRPEKWNWCSCYEVQNGDTIFFGRGFLGMVEND